MAEENLEKHLMPAAPKATCAICSLEGTKVCGGCGVTVYCTKEHQREDWPNHKKTCKQKHKKPAAAAAGSKSDEAAVLWEDQQRINEFGRLNNRLQNLEDELETKKREKLGLDDSKTEIAALLDDDWCKIKVGECYMQVPNEEAEEFVNARLKELAVELAALVEEQNEITTKMAILKKLLYGKFGSSINLEAR